MNPSKKKRNQDIMNLHFRTKLILIHFFIDSSSWGKGFDPVRFYY